MMTIDDGDSKQQQRPLVVLRYPGKSAGESHYAVIQPSWRHSDVYEVASSWFDTEQEALEELRGMRRRRGGR